MIQEVEWYMVRPDGTDELLAATTEDSNVPVAWVPSRPMPEGCWLEKRVKDRTAISVAEVRQQHGQPPLDDSNGWIKVDDQWVPVKKTWRDLPSQL